MLGIIISVLLACAISAYIIYVNEKDEDKRMKQREAEKKKSGYAVYSDSVHLTGKFVPAEKKSAKRKTKAKKV